MQIDFIIIYKLYRDLQTLRFISQGFFMLKADGRKIRHEKCYLRSTRLFLL